MITATTNISIWKIKHLKNSMRVPILVLFNNSAVLERNSRAIILEEIHICRF
jgi:hypothetical protein